MNDLKLDQWEHDLVSRYSIPFPTNDFDAYDYYKTLRWVYDKLLISRSFNSGVYAGIVLPNDSGRYIVRPRFNLQGLGKGVSFRTGDGSRLPLGFFAQSLLKGPHLSVDVREGVQHTYRGYHLPGSTDFYLWKRVPNEPLLVKLPVPYYNYEQIGRSVIECHLRPSIQFWSLPNYSFVVHRDFCDLPEYGMGWIPSFIHDVVRCDSEDRRLLIVNGDDLRSCYQYACMAVSF
jgi:hypothetical protein